MNYKEHQIKYGKLAYEMLKDLGYVYISGEPRTGKSLMAINTCELSSMLTNVLILCPKGAIGYPKKLDELGNEIKDPSGKARIVTNKNSKYYDIAREEGWLKTRKMAIEIGIKHTYDIFNYEQIKKIDMSRYQIVIIDESHNLGVIGKPTSRYKDIRTACYSLPHIHLSGTAITESPNSIFHQMAISKYNPFPYRNFYEFFRQFGKPYYLKLGGRDIPQYDRYKPELLKRVDEFTFYITQEEAGIDASMQSEDKVHYVSLEKETRKLYNDLQDFGVADFNGNTIICDNDMKLRTTLHSLESGTIRVDDEYLELGNLEKIKYIKETFGDTKGVGIMSHFIGERILLGKHFKNAKIFSSTGDAEGVDLTYLTDFIILSHDYRGSKFIQRKERTVNMNITGKSIVNFILVKNAISEQAYKKCSKKEDFNKSTYKKKTI